MRKERDQNPILDRNPPNPQTHHHQSPPKISPTPPEKPPPITTTSKQQTYRTTIPFLIPNPIPKINHKQANKKRDLVHGKIRWSSGDAVKEALGEIGCGPKITVGGDHFEREREREREREKD